MSENCIVGGWKQGLPNQRLGATISGSLDLLRLVSFPLNIGALSGQVIVRSKTIITWPLGVSAELQNALQVLIYELRPWDHS